eukprot:TRINITY_DN90764_c0_g1_i1.p1 TRINITY_DN90764_c0_g1~~TRINITY_DN90764_c0_g1_i1.p1  ORF type:complete len:585 (-),score=151.86 TRINITY_DN90764_c0_g1_i1:187-1941(-)
MPRRIPTAQPGCRPESLKDPCKDRVVTEAPVPPAQLLNLDVFYGDKGQPDIDLLISHLNLEGALSQELLIDIIRKASELFAQEPNLLKLTDPITVVGDIHGQYFDLVKLIEVGGNPADTQYIFLGDYVDRGSFSIEVVATLFSLKIKYPKRIRMLRGNHECRQMTSFFNFREECEYKYDLQIYNAFMDAFDTLPLAATINGKFLAVHGGLSPDLPNLKAVNSIDRFLEPPREGLLCDLLWSDPMEPKEDQPKPKKTAAFVPNEVRGCSYFYSFEGAAKFLQKNSLLSIIRAHEAQLEGYKMHKTNPATGFPSVITIFSAPNYCDIYNNKGAILKFDNSTLNILQFNSSPHPYYLPNFMDIFTWSIPFVIEKVTEMLYYILQPAAGEQHAVLPELPPAVKSMARQSLSASQNASVDLVQRLAQHFDSSGGGAGGGEGQEEARTRLRNKVRTIAKMARMFKTKRQENETVLRLKGACIGDKLNPGLLLAGQQKAHTVSDKFCVAARVDMQNEMRPDLAGGGNGTAAAAAGEAAPGSESAAAEKDGKKSDRDFVDDNEKENGMTQSEENGAKAGEEQAAKENEVKTN